VRTARLDRPMLTLAAAMIAVVAASGSAGAATPPPPATGHAGVIAQANIEFTDGSYQWSVSSEVYNAGAPPTPAVAGSDTFFAVTAGALVAADAATPIARIAAGEALFVRNDATTTVMPADGAAANFLRISLDTGGGGTGDPFTPGSGVRDVDLVRDVLDPGGTLAIPDSDAAPALVVVVTGSVTVAGDPAGSADVAAAAPDTFDGNLTLVNGGTEPAVVLVAVVGTLVQTTAGATPPTGAPTNGDGGPTEPSEPDADGDGLSDADEAEHGTMPNDPDSDGDALSDGEEVHRYGTDPLSSRTDSDHLEDGLEIERGTDPLDEDTDDDGCQDSSDDNPLTGDGDCDGDTLSFDQERQLGTDPANPDTDDDGTDDDTDPNPLTPDEGTPPPPPPPPPSEPSDSTP
jgi:Bacterial TSP3 repeat